MSCLALPRLLSGGDLEGATRCFARDACLLTPDATAIHERESIRLVLAQLIARRARIECEQGSAIVAGEVAFVRQRWRIDSPSVDGDRFEQACEPAFVLRALEGRWKISIAALWGWGDGH